MPICLLHLAITTWVAPIMSRRTAVLRSSKKTTRERASGHRFGRVPSAIGYLRAYYAAYGRGTTPSTQKTIAAVEAGLPVAAVDELRRLGLTNAEIDELVIPARTERHRRERNEPLTAVESERALRVLRIRASAERAFSNADKAVRWLRTPLAIFDGRAPLALLKTEFGAQHVETTLAKIEWGAPV